MPTSVPPFPEHVSEKRDFLPEGSPRLLVGHKGDSMDDLYDKVKDNVALRKKWAGECGVGFALPASIVPNVPEKRVKTKRAKAA